MIELHPVPGCEAIDPAPCDVFSTECQIRLLALAACLRGSSPGPLPPVSRMTEAEFAQLLMAELRAEEPPLNLGDLEAGLAMLGLVAPGAFAPSSMAATQASQVAGFYRDDVNDIVLIDHGSPANGIDVNGIDVNGTLLHEFVHALQDREQDLPTWYDAHTDTYDDTLAAMSVVEGEARLHQTRFRVSLLGLDPMAVDWNKHFDRTVSLATQWVLEQPSPYLASYMAFPYEYGARLLFPRFTERGPQAVTDLFSSPPARTRALLDPGNDAVSPGWPTPVAPSPPAEWTLTHEMTLGAWTTLLFLARAGSFDGPAGPGARLARRSPVDLRRHQRGHRGDDVGLEDRFRRRRDRVDRRAGFGASIQRSAVGPRGPHRRDGLGASPRLGVRDDRRGGRASRRSGRGRREQPLHRRLDPPGLPPGLTPRRHDRHRGPLRLQLPSP